jgi:hypothetical protein
MLLVVKLKLHSLQNENSSLILFSSTLINSGLHRVGYELPKLSKLEYSPPDILEAKEPRKQVEEKNLENKRLRWDFGRIRAHNSGRVSFYSLKKGTRTVGVDLEALKKD